MKIQEIITEAVENDALKLANKILKNCQPYLSQIDYDPVALNMFRGMGGPAEIGHRLKHRNNRKPRDTQQEYSDLIDDWFKDKFGVRYRSAGTFATGNFTDAGMYGVVYSLFPIGEFSFCWSPVVSDMTMKLVKYKLSNEAGNEVDHDDIIAGLHNANYQDTDLVGAIKSGHEIMLYCPNGYFLLNATGDLEKTALQYIYQARAKKSLPRGAKTDMVNKAREHLKALNDELVLINQLFEKVGYTTRNEYLDLDGETAEEMNWNLSDLMYTNIKSLSLPNKNIYRSAAISILRTHRLNVESRIKRLQQFLTPYEN